MTSEINVLVQAKSNNSKSNKDRIVVHISSDWCQTRPHYSEPLGEKNNTNKHEFKCRSLSPYQCRLWVLQYRPQLNDKGRREVYQAKASFPVPVQLLRERKAITFNGKDGVVFTIQWLPGKLSHGILGPSGYDNAASREKTYQQDFARAIEKMSTENRIYMPGPKTWLPINGVLPSLRITPFGKLPVGPWVTHRMASRVPVHADDFVLNILGLVQLSTPERCWKDKQDWTLLCRVILFLPRLIAPTSDPEGEDHFTSPLSEPCLALASCDCEELATLVGFMIKTIRATKASALSWMRKLLDSLTLVFAHVTTRSFHSDSPMSHLTALLVDTAYLNSLLAGRRSPKVPSAVYLLEALFPVCPKIDLDQKTFESLYRAWPQYSADCGGTNTSAFMEKEQLYGTCFAVYIPSISSGCWVPVDTKQDKPGVSFFDLWRASPSFRLQQLDLKTSTQTLKELDEIGQQSLHFQSLDFDPTQHTVVTAKLSKNAWACISTELDRTPKNKEQKLTHSHYLSERFPRVVLEYSL